MEEGVICAGGTSLRYWGLESRWKLKSTHGTELERDGDQSVPPLSSTATVVGTVGVLIQSDAQRAAAREDRMIPGR